MFGFGKKKSSPDNAQQLQEKLGKTRSRFTEGLANFFLGKKPIDAELLEELTTHLITADVGVQLAEQIIAQLQAGIRRGDAGDADAVRDLLHQILLATLQPCEQTLVADGKPFVILMVGVNGVGKTTTIGKLAQHFKAQGKSVLLAAGDTFRAAAVEQLKTWGTRNQVPVIAQDTGADSASVIYDAVQAAQARGIDVVLADTAGRLHTQEGLMNELHKIKRVLAKLDPSFPHQTWLVLDAGTGQNALHQAQQFNAAVGLSGLIITKLDGTAKGGMVFALAHQLGLPIRYIGVGEQVADLQAFNADDFVSALLAP